MKAVGVSVFLVVFLGLPVAQAQMTVEAEAVRQNMAHMISRVVELEREQAALRARYEEQQALLSGRAMREQLPDTPDAMLAWSFNDAGLLLKQEGLFDTAVLLFDASLEVLEEVLEQDHPARGTVLQNAAEALWRQGRAEAFARFSAAADIFEKLDQNEHWRLGALLNSWAMAKAEEGAVAEAEDLYRRAIVVYSRVPHDDIAAPLHNLGVLLMQADRLNESLLLLQQARSILETSGREQSAEMVAVLRMLSQVAGLQERSRDARRYEQRAQRIVEFLQRENKD